MDRDIKAYIDVFRSELTKNMPFWGEILAHIDTVENNDIPTACTNGRIIYYNSSFMKSQSVGQRNYIILHELFHIVLLHFKADSRREKEIWNVASDYVVNGLLEEMMRERNEIKKYCGIRLERPGCGCYLPKYSGQSVEELYHGICSDNKENKKKPYVLLLRSGYGMPVKLKAQKCKMSPGDYDIMTDLSPDEAEALGKEIRDIVEDAMKHWPYDRSSRIVARELAILKHADRLPWKVLLKRFLTAAELEDTSYDHPERKYLHMELILPGVGTESVRSELDNIWAFVDTSGSISADELNRFISELYDICRHFDTKVNIGFWDTYMHEVYRNVTKTELIKCQTSYSGGTDVNAVYDYIESEGIDPKVMLILTDGWFEPLEAGRTRRLRSKTIVVLSDMTDDNVKNLGKIARLK